MSKDGGAAFPVPNAVNGNGDFISEACPGMSLRDYFAAKAMQAIISKTPVMQWNEDDAQLELYSISAGAYSYADAMLKARTK